MMLRLGPGSDHTAAAASAAAAGGLSGPDSRGRSPSRSRSAGGDSDSPESWALAAIPAIQKRICGTGRNYWLPGVTANFRLACSIPTHVEPRAGFLSSPSTSSRPAGPRPRPLVHRSMLMTSASVPGPLGPEPQHEGEPSRTLESARLPGSESSRGPVSEYQRRRLTGRLRLRPRIHATPPESESDCQGDGRATVFRLSLTHSHLLSLIHSLTLSPSFSPLYLSHTQVHSLLAQPPPTGDRAV